MHDYPALAALAEVLRRGSFEGAAMALRVTPSAISQRIKGLEDRLGQVLIQRGPPLAGTEAGLRLARHVEQVHLLEASLGADLMPETGPRRLSLAVNADSLASWVLPALASQEGLLYDLTIDDQDHSADWLKRGAVVAAVTADPGPLPGCDTAALGALRYIATASPGYRARWFPQGLTPEALAEAPALTFNAKDRLQIDWASRQTGRRISPPTHIIGSSQAFIEAATLGLGWGMNPEPLIRSHLAAGTLIPLDPQAPLDVALYWQSLRAMKGPLAPLTAAVRQAARAVLIPI